MSDTFNLNRFLDAQKPVYDGVVGELSKGIKTGHWIWFVFPQYKGLGYSATSRRFAISSLDETRAYLEHETLGARLRECTQLVLNLQGRTAQQIFGHPDYLKFRSCMTLFAQAAPTNKIFSSALDRYFDGAGDPLTIDALG